MRKNVLLMCLCLVFGIAGYGQNKKEAKLYQLLEQKNYTKLVKKSKKLLSKERKNVHANYAMSAYYWIKAAEATTPGSQKKQLARLFRYWKNVPVYQNTYTEQLGDTLHDFIVKMASDSTLKPYINNQYRNWLLVYFRDSVPGFSSPSVPHIVILDSAKISDSLRYAMLVKAKKLEGVKYRWAGDSPKTGFDCSGFTQYVYKQVGITIPHNAQKQSDLSKCRVDLAHVKPGDLVFFGSWAGQKQQTVHAGIVYDVGNNNEITVIHCVSGGVKIEGENSSWDRYWIDRFLFGISMDNLAQNCH